MVETEGRIRREGEDVGEFLLIRKRGRGETTCAKTGRMTVSRWGSIVEALGGVGYLEAMAFQDSADFESALDEAIGRLRNSELRITSPRCEILGVLVGEHGPFTTEEIHRRLGGSRCDLVTVYRCLATMEEVGVVRRCDFGDGVLRSEFDGGADSTDQDVVWNLNSQHTFASRCGLRCCIGNCDRPNDGAALASLRMLRDFPQ